MPLGLSWRAIGPAMFAGRVADVAGVPGKPDILYVGTASSGLYKSVNGGITFDPVFETGNTLSIGAIAVQPDNPDVVYVGTGEGAVRNSISFGDGIYKTTDGGKSWKHLGLQTSERFSRIVIHPTNPQVVLAAAMGKAFGPGGERGIYRSTDGGATWTRTLVGQRHDRRQRRRDRSRRSRTSCTPGSTTICGSRGSSAAAARAAGCTDRPTAA